MLARHFIRHKHNFPFWGFISDNNFAIFATHAHSHLYFTRVIQARVAAETFILMARSSRLIFKLY